MKFLRKLTVAVLILALHAGLLVLMAKLSPPADTRTAKTTEAVLPSTVVVLLALLTPQPTPETKRQRQPTDNPARAIGATSTKAAAVARLAEAAMAIPVAIHPGLATSSTGDSAPSAALNIGIQSLQSAAREADKNSVRSLFLQSGKVNELETAKPHPIALLAAESSEPRCPPATQLRESVGDHGYRLTPDRSSDCARDRSARVRAKALAR